MREGLEVVQNSNWRKFCYKIVVVNNSGEKKRVREFIIMGDKTRLAGDKIKWSGYNRGV